MLPEKSATLRVEYIRRSIVGTVEVQGAATKDAQPMKGEGWRRTATGWSYTLRKELEKGWEKRTARNIVHGLWEMAMVYGVTRWIAADEEVLTLAHPELAELMLTNGSGDGREARQS